MTSLRSASAALPPIRAALTRSKKESIRRELDSCQMLAGIWCHGLTVRQLQSIRASLPSSSKLLVAKNSLVEKAIEGTKWEALKPCAKGMNAWLFVHSDEIPPAIKPYREFQKEWKLALNDFAGAVYEGRLYGPDDFQALETMPTRMESYRFLLGCLQSPAVSLLGLLQTKTQEEGGAEVAATDAEKN
ncbi:50S ribosomal protein L10 [Rhynchospora pubera]|uniref:Large ribosomal subunit protein uL10c n=1 Tax=Rhynchospora pubera TaxID=906938 RepID=A0AAV8C9I6_9POAL|nr:50S ribosomal protein L10 [Rhynchospora pubera]